MLIHYPRGFGRYGRKLDARLDIPDVMPTLLGLCSLPVPPSVEGLDFSGYLHGGPDLSDGAALLSCPHPFGQWPASQGGREYRGLRTERYTYVRDLDGPWLFYDNEQDPYQLENLVDRPAYAHLQAALDAQLTARLDAQGDEFLPGMAYIERWGYPIDETGTVPYQW